MLLQTFSPDHPVMQALVGGDLQAFMTAEADGRRPGHWPPYGRLVALIVSADTAQAADEVARRILARVTDVSRYLRDGQKVWLTETGGIVKFGRSFPRDEKRAARSIRFAFKLARDNERVKRVYLYNWTGAQPDARFDSGLIGSDGTARPGYDALKAALED